MGPPQERSAKKCLFCRGNVKPSSKKDNAVKGSLAVSICTIFGIPDNHPFKIIYENSQYCEECLGEVREADLTLGKLEILKQNLLRFQDRVYSKLGDNYFQIKNRNEFKISYKEFEKGEQAVRGRKFGYDEIVKIIYEKLDQDCLQWERFSSEAEIRLGALNAGTGVKKSDCATQTDFAISEEIAPHSVITETILPDNDDHDNDDILCLEAANNYDVDLTGGGNNDTLETTRNSTAASQATTSYKYEPMDITLAAPELSFTQAPTNFDKTISCTYDPENCKRFFYDEYNLKVHVKSFHEGNPLPHECMACDKAFSEEGRLKTHYLRVHASTGSFMCEHCGKGFSWPSLLKDHVRKIHLRKSAEQHPCVFCGAPFDSKQKLKEHDNLHSAKKSPFDCVYCDAPQPNSIIAKEHYLNCHSENKFKCDKCGKTLSTLSSLKSHMKLHSGSFQCDMCPYAAPSQNSLNAHKMSHSSEKPYACELCGSCYKYSKNLTAHMRCHTGEKPYLCNVCGATFREHSYLKRHEESHSSENLYNCSHEKCTKKFKTKESLKKHVRTIHVLKKKSKSKAKGQGHLKKIREKSSKVLLSPVKCESGVIEIKKSVPVRLAGAKTKHKKKQAKLLARKESPSRKNVLKQAKKKRSSKEMACKVEEVEMETQKIQPVSYATAQVPMTQEELNSAVASIESQQTQEIPANAVFENATVVYGSHYELTPATYELVPISTPVTVVNTQGINVVRASMVTRHQTPQLQQYRVEYKYT